MPDENNLLEDDELYCSTCWSFYDENHNCECNKGEENKDDKK